VSTSLRDHSEAAVWKFTHWRLSFAVHCSASVQQFLSIASSSTTVTPFDPSLSTEWRDDVVELASSNASSSRSDISGKTLHNSHYAFHRPNQFQWGSQQLLLEPGEVAHRLGLAKSASTSSFASAFSCPWAPPVAVLPRSCADKFRRCSRSGAESEFGPRNKTSANSFSGYLGLRTESHPFVEERGITAMVIEDRVYFPKTRS